MSATLPQWLRHQLPEELPSIPSLISQLSENASGAGWKAKASKKLLLATANAIVGMRLPFAKRNHFKLLDLKPGYLKALIRFAPNKNHINTLYAGAMFTLAEIPGGVLALTHFDSAYYPILKSMTMTYLKTAKSDVTIEFHLPKEEVERITQEADQNGKCDFTLQGELKDQQGQVVALSEGHYQIRKSS